MVMLKMKIYTKSSKKDIMSMVTILESEYKDAKCGLDYNSPFSLVISLILAAQCTDARVNVICPILLSKYPNASQQELAQMAQNYLSTFASEITGANKPKEKSSKTDTDFSDFFS